jgi:urea transport system substrate-binding protein
MKTILIIEDEDDILFTLSDFLIFEGYNVSTATNGLLAMEILKTSVVPDLILLDMKMPVMNGWEFASAFHDKYGEISPIVVMTAAREAKARANDIGAVGWIEKPFDLDVFLKKVKTFEKK